MEGLKVVIAVGLGSLGGLVAGWYLSKALIWMVVCLTGMSERMSASALGVGLIIGLGLSWLWKRSYSC